MPFRGKRQELREYTNFYLYLHVRITFPILNLTLCHIHPCQRDEQIQRSCLNIEESVIVYILTSGSRNTHACTKKRKREN